MLNPVANKQKRSGLKTSAKMHIAQKGKHSAQNTLKKTQHRGK